MYTVLWASALCAMDVSLNQCHLLTPHKHKMKKAKVNCIFTILWSDRLDWNIFLTNKYQILLNFPNSCFPFSSSNFLFLVSSYNIRCELGPWNRTWLDWTVHQTFYNFFYIDKLHYVLFDMYFCPEDGLVNCGTQHNVYPLMCTDCVVLRVNKDRSSE